MSSEIPAPVPTEQPEALKSFVEGREQFYAYLGSGSGSELEKASDLFAEAAKRDPEFDLALLYHAVTRVELRDSDTAITELQKLIAKGGEFLPEAHLHLAYARAKKYKDEEFFEAEKELKLATVEAARTGNTEIEPTIQAYRVFLYSVMGGRLSEADSRTRKAYIDKAIQLGEKNLRKRLWRRDPRSVALIKLELNNGLGIAYMRKGEEAPAFSSEQEESWRLARRYFQTALGLEVNPVRVRQNIGTLLEIEGDQWRKKGNPAKADAAYRNAVQEYEASIALNPFDQFPHYQLARLYVRRGEWDKAAERLAYGRQQKGAVEPASWERLEKAITQTDASVLDRRASS